jgi:hypothetical protein
VNPIATAKQTSSLLSLAGLAWVLSHLPSFSASGVYADLRGPAIGIIASAALYLLLLGLQAFARSVEAPNDFRGECVWAAAHGMVLAVVAASLLRGPRSFVLLAGLEGLLSVVATISAVALAVSGYASWLSQRENDSFARASAASLPSTSIVRRCLLPAIAALPLVVSTVYLEYFPNEAVQRAQFQSASEV